MKASSIAILICAATAGMASAQLPNPAPIGSPQHTRAQAINQEFERSVVELRARYLAKRTADGGALSASDRAAMQRRYDRLYADYRRKLRNTNPFSVDASGHSQANYAARPPISPGSAPVYSN